MFISDHSTKKNLAVPHSAAFALIALPCRWNVQEASSFACFVVSDMVSEMISNAFMFFFGQPKTSDFSFSKHKQVFFRFWSPVRFFASHSTISMQSNKNQGS
jgi:hypothetical protein